MSRTLLAVAAVVALVPSTAVAAPSRAWTAAKSVHIDAPIIAGIDVASAKASESFKKFYPLLISSKPEVKEVLDKLQSICKFDPFTAVKSAVAVVDDTADNKGAFYIALAGWDAAKLGACAKKVAKKEGKDKQLVIGPVKKGIQQLTMKDKSEKVYLGWLGKDVLVVATDPTDRAFVESMIAGKGTGEANALAAKLDTSSTLWMVVIKSQEIQKNIQMKALYGTVKVAAGNVDGDVRVVTGGEKQATMLVTEFNKELPKMQQGLPPAAHSLAKSMKVTSAGAEVQATASAPEKDILSILSLLLSTL